jgi:uncharacterized Rmd1/YagE family protein
MTQDKFELLKSQLPISLEVTMSMDYPNGIKEDATTFAKITGTIGSYGVIITWKYELDPNNIIVEYINMIDGNEVTIPILQLKEFLLKLKG